MVLLLPGHLSQFALFGLTREVYSGVRSLIHSLIHSVILLVCHITGSQTQGFIPSLLLVF